MEKETLCQCWIDKELGRGSFGNVYLLSCSRSSKRTHLKYALKVIEEHGMRAQDQKAAHKELCIMRGLYHPSIITLIDSFQLPHRLLLVLELCEGGDLRNFLDNFKRKGGTHSRQMMGIEQSLVVQWTLQLTSGLQYLHHKKILHRDLKPQNIFLKDQVNIKIGDLGIAKQLVHTKQMADTHIGTPLYISPEIYQGNSYSYKTDVWSLGCCVYEMMTLQYAFHAPSRYELVGKVVNKEVLPLPQCYSCSLRNLVLCMLCKDPDDRPHAKQLLASLQELNTEQPQPQGQRSEVSESEQDTSQRPKDHKSLQDWRLDMARALTQFLKQKQAMQYAQLNAALAQNLTAASIRDIDDSSGEDSSHTAASRPRARFRTSSKSTSSETANEEDVDGGEMTGSSSAMLCHSFDVTLSSKDTQTQNSSGHIPTPSGPQSQAERGDGRCRNGNRLQSGHPRQCRQGRTENRLEMCDDGDGGSCGGESDDDSDRCALRAPLPGVRSQPSYVKIGKSSMVVRTRPLPHPQIHKDQAHSVEKSLEQQSTSATAASSKSSSSLASQNSAIKRESSSHRPLANHSRSLQSEFNPHQISNSKDVVVAYANEVLQWARDKLLPSAPQNMMDNSCHDHNRCASSGEADSTHKPKASSAMTDKRLRARDKAAEKGANVRDKVTDKEAGMKYGKIKNSVRNVAEEGAGEQERATGACVDADSTGQVPVSQDKGKKKKRNFLRERKVKQVEDNADRHFLKDVKAADRSSVDKPVEHEVTLYTRAQCVSFASLKADDMDLSIGGESYI